MKDLREYIDKVYILNNKNDNDNNCSRNKLHVRIKNRAICFKTLPLSAHDVSDA